MSECAFCSEPLTEVGTKYCYQCWHNGECLQEIVSLLEVQLSEAQAACKRLQRQNSELDTTLSYYELNASGGLPEAMEAACKSARAEGRREERESLLKNLSEREAELRELGANISAHIPAADILHEEAAALRALDGEEGG